MTDEFHYSDERDKRVKETGEIFTPPDLVNKMLDELGYDWTQDHSKSKKTFLDPTMGSGNFLVEIAKRGILPENIYGVDLMEDNVQKSKERLREIYKKFNHKDIDFHLDRNIIQADALTYDYNFWEKPDLEDEW